MRIRIIEESQSFSKGEEFEVFSILNGTSGQDSFLSLMVKTQHGLVALDISSVEILDPTLTDFEFIKNSKIAGGGFVLHKIFSKNVDFYTDVVEFHEGALAEFNRRLKLYMLEKKHNNY